MASKGQGETTSARPYIAIYTASNSFTYICSIALRLLKFHIQAREDEEGLNNTPEISLHLIATVLH